MSGTFLGPFMDRIKGAVQDAEGGGGGPTNAREMTLMGSMKEAINRGLKTGLGAQRGLADAADHLLFGANRDDLASAAPHTAHERVQDLPDFGGDKVAHTYAAQRMAERLGGVPAEAILNAKELIQGGASVLGGGKFAGGGGYDPQDIEANMRGIKAAFQEGSGGGGSGGFVDANEEFDPDRKESGPVEFVRAMLRGR